MVPAPRASLAARCATESKTDVTLERVRDLVRLPCTGERREAGSHAFMVLRRPRAAILPLCIGMVWSVWSAGCKVVNASHCGNRHGDATCREQDPSRPYCSVCTVDHDGCIAEKVVNPDCMPHVSGSSSGGGTSVAGTSSGAATSMSSATSTTAAASSSGGVTGGGSSGGGPVCGDGVAQGNEACDGTDLGGKTCADFGSTGTLACDPTNCTYVTTGCAGFSMCGDGMVTGSEICDSGDTPNMTYDTPTCMDLTGKSGGKVTCSNCVWNTSGCCIEMGQQCMYEQDCCPGTSCTKVLGLAFPTCK